MSLNTIRITFLLYIMSVNGIAYWLLQTLSPQPSIFNSDRTLIGVLWFIAVITHNVLVLRMIRRMVKKRGETF